MGRGPRKGTSPLDRVYREIAVLKKVGVRHSNGIINTVPYLSYFIRTTYVHCMLCIDSWCADWIDSSTEGSVFLYHVHPINNAISLPLSLSNFFSLPIFCSSRPVGPPECCETRWGSRRSTRRFAIFSFWIVATWRSAQHTNRPGPAGGTCLVCFQRLLTRTGILWVWICIAQKTRSVDPILYVIQCYVTAFESSIEQSTIPIYFIEYWILKFETQNRKDLASSFYKSWIINRLFVLRFRRAYRECKHACPICTNCHFNCRFSIEIPLQCIINASFMVI